MRGKKFSNVTASKRIERKTMKKAKKQWVVKSLLFSSILGGSLLISNVEALAQEQNTWVARSSEQIKSDIKRNEYIIQWGDTLSAISEATNISVNRLAEINQITDVDLIYAGNKLIFGGEINSKTGEDNRVVAIQDSTGKTSVVINADEKKPVINQTETGKAKKTEQSGGTYTPSKTDNSGKKPLPTVPTVPEKPTPEPPILPVDPENPKEPTPEPPVKPIEPEESEVDKTQLIALFNSTTSYVSTDYEEKSWTAFNGSRQEAKKVIDNPNALLKEVITAITNLQNGINQLVPIEKPVIVDKTALTGLYNSTIDYVSTDYEISSWEQFKVIRQESYKLLSDSNATQQQIDAMAIALQNAINQLVPITIEETDKTALTALVEKVKGYQPKDYTEESWNNFHQAFTTAVNLLADDKATQQDIIDAQNNLSNAIASLEKVKEDVVNKKELMNLYNDSASLSSEDYTEKSWNDYILIRSDTKSILENKTATQQEVDQIYKKLEESIKKLEKKSTNWENLELGVPTYSAEISKQFEESINTYRQAHGVFTLPTSKTAREKSNATASKNVSPDWTKWSASHGGQQVGTTWGSITFYSESDAVQKAISNFDNSSSHKANLLESDPDFAESLGGSVYIMKSIDKTTGATMYSYLFIGTIYSW